MDNGETLLSEACEPVHSWSVSLARTHPAKSVIVLCAIVVGSAAVAALYDNAAYGLLSCAVLIGSTFAYWVPRRYSTYRDRLEVAFRLPIKPITYPWRQFRHCASDGSVLRLTSLPEGHPLARYRGVTVFLPPESQAIVAQIGTCVDAAQPPIGSD